MDRGELGTVDVLITDDELLAIRAVLCPCSDFVSIYVIESYFRERRKTEIDVESNEGRKGRKKRGKTLSRKFNTTAVVFVFFSPAAAIRRQTANVSAHTDVGAKRVLRPCIDIGPETPPSPGRGHLLFLLITKKKTTPNQPFADTPKYNREKKPNKHKTHTQPFCRAISFGAAHVSFVSSRSRQKRVFYSVVSGLAVVQKAV